MAGDSRRAGRPAANGARDAGDTNRFETAFLQLVMERLWVEETSTGSQRLRLETLNGLGGAETITRSHLDDAMAELSVNQRDAAAAAFRFLVTPSGTKMALTAAELSEFSAVPESVLKRGCSKHLEDERIMRPVTSPESHDGGPGGQASRYELLHDVLGDAALDWRKRHDAERQKKILLREHEDAEQRKLAEAAEQHQAQRNRIIRRAAIGLSCLVVLLIAAVTWAVYERNEAAQEREVARSRALAATADSQLQSDPERSILLAREALDIRETREAAAALRRALGASRLRLRIPAGHGLAQAVAAPDGRTVATVTNPGRVRFWRTSDGQEIDVGVTVPWEVSDIAYSRDGSKVVVAGDGGVILHRLAPGATPRRLGPPRLVYTASFSADGRYVATGGDSGAVVWSASTDGASQAKPLKKLGPKEPVIDIEFNPRDSGSLAAATFTDAYLLSRTGEDRRRLRRPGTAHAHPGAIESLFPPTVSFGPNGRYLATALRAFDARVRGVSPERGPNARIWDARTGRFVRELKASKPPRGVNMMSWSPDNSRVAIATGKRVEVFETASGRPRLALTGHGDWVWTAQFSPDGTLLVTASQDGTARVWDARSGGELAVLRGHSSDVSSAEFGQTGDWVLTTGRDGTARVWDTRVGREVGHHRDWVVAAAYSPDGRLAVTGAEDGSVRVWSLHGRGASQTIDTDELDQVTDVEFDARSERILATGTTAERGVRIVLVADARSGEIISRLSPGMLITDATFSPGGRQVAIFSALGRPEIWDTGRRKRVAKLKYPDTAGVVGPLKGRYSPDGRSIVTGGSDGVARVFNARTGRQEYAFRGHDGVVAGAAFSRDGQRALSFGFDGTARVWGPGGGELLALRGHDGSVTSAEFSPDGDRIVTGGADRTVRVWDAQTGELLGILRPMRASSTASRSARTGARSSRPATTRRQESRGVSPASRSTISWHSPTSASGASSPALSAGSSCPRIDASTDPLRPAPFVRRPGVPASASVAPALPGMPDSVRHLLAQDLERDARRCTTPLPDSAPAGRWLRRRRERPVSDRRQHQSGRRLVTAGRRVGPARRGAGCTGRRDQPDCQHDEDTTYPPTSSYRMHIAPQIHSWGSVVTFFTPTPHSLEVDR